MSLLEWKRYVIEERPKAKVIYRMDGRQGAEFNAVQRARKTGHVHWVRDAADEGRVVYVADPQMLRGQHAT